MSKRKKPEKWRAYLLVDGRIFKPKSEGGGHYWNSGDRVSKRAAMAAARSHGPGMYLLDRFEYVGWCWLGRGQGHFEVESR